MVESKAFKVLIRIALAGLVAYFFLSRSAELRANVSERDSVAYWSAGQLLLHHQNPYDAGHVLELEQQQGYKQNKPLVLRTPPWSLFLVLPLGLVNAFWAWLLWIAVSLGALLLATRLCWKMYGVGVPQNLFWLVGYTFAPVPACLVAGQMGILLLLGVVLFLLWEPERPFLAGAALVLPFAKPHLLSLFWVAFLFWLVTRKKRAAAGGFAAAFVAATSVALLFNPDVFRHYREMLYHASIGNEFIPGFSGVVRLIFFHRLFWVQFIPMAIGLLWCAWFCYLHRPDWNWREHAPALMVVSVLTTPYSWLTDEVVLLPAILQATVYVYSARQGMRLKSRFAVTIFACLNGLLLLILSSKVPFSTGIYFWSSLVWFLWYVYGRSRSRAQFSRPQAELPAATS
jgi:hypothetical protein